MVPLPLSESQQNEKNILGMKKIMIVEDDTELLEELQTTLLHQNYDVEAVSNSEKAFDIACKVKPDLIITDLKMRPKNGFMLVDELQASGATNTIPIIVMTGFFTQKEHFVMMKMAGMKHVVIKPFDPTDLLAKIETVLRS